MKNSKHGLSIGIQREGNEFYLTLKIEGKLTHEDYELMVPMINNAISGFKEPKIKALVDITQLDGWTLEAMWDDFKFGLQHGSEFTKIAVVGNKNWQEWASKVGSWFIGGEIKSFHNENEAIEWLKA